MYFKPSKTSFLTIMAAFVLISTSVGQSNKDENVKIVLACISKIEKLSSKEENNQSSNNRIDEIVNTLNNAVQLEMFAMMCDSIVWPQNAKDCAYDRYFVDAFWKAIAKIEKLPTEQARRCLAHLKHRIPLDGGDLLRFEEIEIRLGVGTNE